MPPTLIEAAEELILAIQETSGLFGQTADEYIDKGGWSNQHWQDGFKMLREAMAAYDVSEALIQRATDVFTSQRIDDPYEIRVIRNEISPPQTSLPPLRWTERRDPCSADARGEWTDFD